MAQVRAIEHYTRRLQIPACAGSGKTEVLARRAVRLLTEDRDPAGLIAFTFTEKAARERKARIAALVRAGHRPCDIAILFRSVRTSARPFRRALDRHGVRFVQVGTSALLDRPETALIARILVFWAGGRWFP